MNKKKNKKTDKLTPAEKEQLVQENMRLRKKRYQAQRGGKVYQFRKVTKRMVNISGIILYSRHGHETPPYIWAWTI